MKQLNALMVVFFSVFFVMSDSKAQESDIEKSGQILRIGLPASALVSSFIIEKQEDGLVQAAAAFGTTYLTTVILKRIVDKERPDGEKYAFPSGHASISFSAAAFMQKRYGWEFGIPFYLLAGYVGWSRVYADRHDYWDVLGGVGLGIGCSYLFTKSYERNRIDVMFKRLDDSYMIEMGYKF
jgi:membrane-associated phospholipid phosphatase